MKSTIFNSFCYIGNVSLKVNIALLMDHGIDPISIPTKTFSAHMGYEGFVIQNEIDIDRLISSVEKIMPEVDMVQIGYVDESDVFNRIKKYLGNVKYKKLIVDPIHGDDGKYYSGASKTQLEYYRELIKDADLITPNLTEAMHLANYDKPFEKIDKEDVIKIANKLRSIGPKAVIIKSYVENGKIMSYFEDEFSSGFAESPVVNCKFVGTGDAFATLASILCIRDELNIENIQKLQTTMYSSLYAQSVGKKLMDVETGNLRV